MVANSELWSHSVPLTGVDVADGARVVAGHPTIVCDVIACAFEGIGGRMYAVVGIEGPAGYLDRSLSMPATRQPAARGPPNSSNACRRSGVRCRSNGMSSYTKTQPPFNGRTYILAVVRPPVGIKMHRQPHARINANILQLFMFSYIGGQLRYTVLSVFGYISDSLVVPS